MAASSATGTGVGNSRKPTVMDLAIFANGPAIYAVGSVDIGEGDSPPSSPPSFMATVTLPTPLPGQDAYAIFLTAGEGSGNVYVADIMDDEDLNLTGFVVGSETEGTVYYMVVKKGFRNP